METAAAVIIQQLRSTGDTSAARHIWFNILLQLLDDLDQLFAKTYRVAL